MCSNPAPVPLKPVSKAPSVAVGHHCSGQANGLRRVMLISNEVFHYRVSNYNYFTRRFREEGYEFIVRANALQKNNPYDIEFDFQTVAFGFLRYKRENPNATVWKSNSISY